jgi:hypothetical protein
MEPLTMICIYIGYQALKMLAAHADTIERTLRLTWNTVYGWLTARKTNANDVGRLIQQEMANGTYRVVCGVFSGNGQTREKVVWDCSEMDYELRQRLGSRKEISIEL